MEVLIREGGAARLLAVDDSRFLAQCRVDTYTASGPGGQHRNRTYSAVRLTHIETGISVTGEERRSQQENKRKALGRLRMALALQVRAAEFQLAEYLQGIFAAPGPVRVNSKNKQYPQVCAAVLDALYAAKGSLSSAAVLLGISTGRLVKLISREGEVLTAANRLREYFGFKPIKISY